MEPSQANPGKGETIVGLVILAALLAIATGMFVKQFHYEPFSTILMSDAHRAAAPGEGLDLAGLAPEGLIAVSPREQFAPENLSDKINGKAETYLSAGFVALTCRRFSDSTADGNLVQAYAYDMGSSRNAYTVYSSQIRPGTAKLNLGDFAYKTQNAVFFTHGKYYVELVGATGETDPVKAKRSLVKLMDPVLAFARSFVENVRATSETIRELELFPPEGLVPDSITRTTADEFGVPGFDNVFRATYAFGGRAATVFLSRADTPEQGVKLAESYRDYYAQFGARGLDAPEGIPGAKMLDLDGIYKLVFSCGNFVAGVDESPSKQAAQTSARLLYDKLKGARP